MKFRLALAFFTRLPVGAPLSNNFDGILAWFPVIGLIIGSLVGLSMGIFALFLPSLLCGFLACLTWAFLTGGLHLDGVCDCGDGLLVEASPKRRLEIMKDSHIGTFGTMALFFVLGAKTLALSILCEFYEIGDNFSHVLSLILICASAGAVARAMNFIALQMPSAREGGLGDAMRKGLSQKDYILALCLILVLCVLNGARGFFMLIFVAIISFLFLRAVKKRIGGVTGDVLGCLTELTECAVLFASCVGISTL